jgi:hypothetical protein
MHGGQDGDIGRNIAARNSAALFLFTFRHHVCIGADQALQEQALTTKLYCIATVFSCRTKPNRKAEKKDILSISTGTELD